MIPLPKTKNNIQKQEGEDNEQKQWCIHGPYLRNLFSNESSPDSKLCFLLSPKKSSILQLSTLKLVSSQAPSNFLPNAPSTSLAPFSSFFTLFLFLSSPGSHYPLHCSLSWEDVITVNYHHGEPCSWPHVHAACSWQKGVPHFKKWKKNNSLGWCPQKGLHQCIRSGLIWILFVLWKKQKIWFYVEEKKYGHFRLIFIHKFLVLIESLFGLQVIFKNYWPC